MIVHTACFTGHRIIPKAELPIIIQRLDEAVAEHIERGIVYFISGAARGFDTLAALAVLRQRENNPSIKLILVLPCRDQEKKWTRTDKKQYQYLLENADDVICLSECYYEGCMAVRNKFMVKKSSLCITYMTYKKSGTFQTVRFALEKGLMVINLSS